MARFASFDPSTSSPHPVIGWYDTGVFTYPSMPPDAALLPVTDSQWEARMANPSGWLVQAGALVAMTPAVVVPAQQSPIRAELAELDATIPRGLEDTWAAMQFDTSKLPTATLQKLSRKQTLRLQLAALIAAGTA